MLGELKVNLCTPINQHRGKTKVKKTTTKTFKITEDLQKYMCSLINYF